MNYILVILIFISLGSFLSGLGSAIRSVINGTVANNNRPYIYFGIAFLVTVIINIIAVIFR